MVYFTGDIHGNPAQVIKFAERMRLTNKDIIVILGDVGANYFRDIRDDMTKNKLNDIGVPILCIHGNHEIRPENIPSYKSESWKCGKVWCEDTFPNLKFAKDGEIYLIDEKRYITIGGAYSVDRFYRQAHGIGWWEDEQPSDKTKAYVEKQMTENEYEIVLSHTCPYKYVPTDMFLPGIDQAKVDNSTEKWLDKIEEQYRYQSWLCGHWHIDRQVDKIHFLYNTWETADNLEQER